MSNMQTMVTLNADKLKSEIRKNMRVGLNTMVWGGPGTVSYTHLTLPTT